MFFLTVQLFGTVIKMYYKTVYTLQLLTTTGKISKTGADGWRLTYK